jgi:hypothetical protein
MGTFRYRLSGSTIRPTPILDKIHIAYEPDFGGKFNYHTFQPSDSAVWHRTP